jgi:hypothetical protein
MSAPLSPLLESHTSRNDACATRPEGELPEADRLRGVRPSVVTSKPANGGKVKTGLRECHPGLVCSILPARNSRLGLLGAQGWRHRHGLVHGSQQPFPIPLDKDASKVSCNAE